MFINSFYASQKDLRVHYKDQSFNAIEGKKILLGAGLNPQIKGLCKEQILCQNSIYIKLYDPRVSTEFISLRPAYCGTIW
jgi:hypothetical protein